MMKRNILHAALLCAALTAAAAWAEDPDYSDTPEGAETVTTDGTIVQGTLTTGDVDWFKFTPVPNTLYRVTLSGQLSAGYKNMEIYQIDAFANLHVTINHNVWSNAVSVRTFFIERAEDIYLKVYNNPGSYAFQIESIGQYLPDAYADQCEAATTITVDAAPLHATLTHNPDGSLEKDWFVFDTTPLHMYQINLTKCDNTDVNFQVFSETCEYLLGGSKSRTVTSWFGEQYKIYVVGNAAHLGTYYTLEVIDLGAYPDDYSSIWETAEPILPDAGLVEGVIQFASSYRSDEDWFVFTPAANTLYQVTLTGEINKGYKSMQLFQIDAFDNLRSILNHNVWSNAVSVKTFFLEAADDVYVKIYQDPGNYTFLIEPLGHYPPDGFSDDCAGATQMAVDAGPLTGTLTHNPNGSLEKDWFVFDTQPLHMYQINLTKCDNTDVNFQVFSDTCELLLGSSKTRTVTSWFGEQYKICVVGNATYLGTYYTLEVVDLGAYPDDFANIAADAAYIPKDGTLVEGEIQYVSSYHSDEDWLTFVAGRDGDYQFTLSGEISKGYKSIRVFWQDELGVLRLQKQENVWSDGVKNFTLTLLAGRIYIQMYSNLGGYMLSVVSPEPRCGDLDHPYPPGDANKDCYVNLADLALMGQNWLGCTDPNPPCSYLP